MANSSVFENCALQVTFLVTFLTAGAVSVRFSIDRQVDQIFRIIMAEPFMETSDLKMVMTPADFNFLIPFNVKMACGVGSMVPQDMRRVHQEDIYMDAINEYETFVNIRFTVSEIDFKWELCWLSLVIPVPMWLRGKILQSTYHMNAKVTYRPNCEFTVTKVIMESYGKIRLNIFNWLPRGLGDKMSEMLARNTQDRIQDTVTKSIVKTVENMTALYDPCIAFPAMGRLKELRRRDDPFEEPEEDPQLAAIVPEKGAGNVLTPEQETILVDKLQRQPRDQAVSITSGTSTTISNEGIEEKYVAEIKSGEQNKIHEEKTSDDAADRSKFNPTEARANAEDDFENISSSVERNLGIEHNPDSGMLESTGIQKWPTREDEERLTVDQDQEEENEVEDQYEVGREDTSGGDGDNNSKRPLSESKSEL